MKNNDNYFQNGDILLENPYIVIREKLIDLYISNYKSQIKNNVIFDIGGYRGETAILFSKLGLAKKVFVYESLKYNFECITKNVYLNKTIKKIKAYNIGVGLKKDTILLKSAYPPWSSAFGLPGNKYVQTIKVVLWN